MLKEISFPERLKYFNCSFDGNKPVQSHHSVQTVHDKVVTDDATEGMSNTRGMSLTGRERCLFKGGASVRV